MCIRDRIWRLSITRPPDHYSVLGWLSRNILTKWTLASKWNKLFVYSDVWTWGYYLWQHGNKHLPHISYWCQFICCAPSFSCILVVRTKVLKDSFETIGWHFFAANIGLPRSKDHRSHNGWSLALLTLAKISKPMNALNSLSETASHCFFCCQDVDCSSVHNSLLRIG